MIQASVCVQKLENNVNMGWHNHIFRYLQIVIPLLQCQELFLCDASLLCQNHFGPFFRASFLYKRESGRVLV